MSTDNNNGILNDQPINVSTGTNAKHIAIGVGIAILVLVVTGAIVFGVYTYIRRNKSSSYSRKYSGRTRTNNPKYYASQRQQTLPTMETRMVTPTTQKSSRQKTWTSTDSSKSVDELVKKPEAVKGDDNNV